MRVKYLGFLLSFAVIIAMVFGMALDVSDAQTCSGFDALLGGCTGSTATTNGGTTGTWTNTTETYEYSGMWPVLKQPWYFSKPIGVAIDGSGNVYVVDFSYNRIEKFTNTGKFITKWGSKGSGNGQFDGPRGIAIDSSGNIYVVDTLNNRVQKFTADGQFITRWGSKGSGNGQFDYTEGIAIDSNDNVYVIDAINYRIQKFTSNGQFITKWGAQGTGSGQFVIPVGIATDSSGNVYVGDKSNGRIQKFTKDGQFIAQWGNEGSGDGQFFFPNGIAIDNSDVVYVIDKGNGRIQKFTPDGVFISSWGSNGGLGDGKLHNPYGIAIDNSGNVFVSDYDDNSIQSFSTDGKFITKWSSEGYGDGQFRLPNSIAINKSSNVLYVLDLADGNPRVQKFNADGQFIAKWGSKGSGDGKFQYPQGIAIDSSGNVYVADALSDRIQSFTANGEFIQKWGSKGSSDGQFNLPYGIAIDNSNNVYVADGYNNRVQKFTSDGRFITKWGSQGSGDGQFDVASGIAIDSSNNVYVADGNNDRIQKFTADGQFITKWGSAGSENGQFYLMPYDAPTGIAIDGSNNVYIVDYNNNRVQKFDLNGTYITTLISFGSDTAQVTQPAGIAVSIDGTIYISELSTNRIQKLKSSSTTTGTKKPKAIIVAGGGMYSSNNLWNATELNANYAYRALNYQGFTTDNIYYISPDTQLDLNNDGEPDIRGDATNANLQYAIIEWAKDAESVVLYMVDHGGIDSFRMGQTETLSAADLNTWLNTLQETMTGNLTVIYDACHSGSFISKLSPASGKQRMLIMSTSSGEAAYFLTDGSLSFSSFFWNYVFSGTTTYQAFEYAKKSAIKGQDPLLDANGNGIGNEETDLSTAKTHYLGGSYSGSGYMPYIYIAGLGGLGYVDSSGLLVGEDIPYISEVSSDQTLNGQTGSSADITLTGQTEANISIGKITTTGTIDHVWAVVKRPDFVNNPDNAVTSLPIIEFRKNTTTNKYEGTYKDFSQTGTYTLNVYAHDSRDGTASPFVITVKQTAGATTCNYTVTGVTDSYTSTGGTGSAIVNVENGCTWTTSSAVSWISASPSSSTGYNWVSYTVAPNTGATSRQGVIRIAGYDYTVTQDGATATTDNCTVKLESRNNDYYFNVPIVTLSLNGSTSNYYAELIYVPKNDNQFWFKLTANAGVVTDISSFSSCQHSTITASGNDFVLHLAKVDLSGTSIWADLKYSPTDDGSLWFVYTGSGSN